MNANNLNDWWNFTKQLVIPATLGTIRLVLLVVVIGYALGFIMGSILYIYSPNGLNPNKKIFRIANFLVNVIRSIPILILIVALFPLTRAIIGTSVGPNAVIIPLALAATAFIGRYLENIFNAVDRQTIEAARSYGANNFDIMRYIVVRESIPGMVSTLTLAIINNIAGSTIAGAVGGGGIGAIAINYGYQSFNNAVLYTAVVILYLMVQVVQTVGNKIYEKQIENS
ncbi:methionine ABC transporter permease [Aedoeadaptatus urinae]|uniref:methionine ABC transporter permease n=1 Tax=Aedoeadaptatus urinae TaxID=1871017 RepID=UPI00097D7EA5|nr:methionine ABC transporter permease [Peptoniphilus urinae]